MLNNRLSQQKRSWVSVLILMCLLLTSISVIAQNVVSGELTGTVVDTSGAVMPNVTVTLKNPQMGFSQTTTTSSSGFFRFALLRPGTYTVSASPTGFAVITRDAVVNLGQVTDVKLQPTVAGKSESVNVTAEAPLLQTENGNVTANFNGQQLASIPTPGNDMTNFAFTAPGITLSTGAGYGNFTAFGLPGTSNLFTVNGSDNNDPFNGLNNSGASNNMLGTNELEEMTVVTNGYTGQYGRAAGANINFTTRSGSNQFHGNAQWEWNGRVLNANDWFNNNSDTPRPFANSNMWAGRIGGPIKKDKVFFFYDNEGMRYVLPGGGTHYIPSPQFASATLANIAATQPAELPFYQNFFKLYAGATGAARATPVTTNDDSALGCGDFAGAYSGGGTFGTDVPCAVKFTGGGSNKNVERLMSLKIDVIPNGSDRLSFRYWQDRGLQATYTDAINPVFNAQSTQPQDQGQVNWTKTLNNHMVNQLILAGSYYSAIFSATDLTAARAAFPTTFISTDGLFDYLGGEDYAWPQGRRVSQAQLIDDFSWTKGNHNLKFGVNLRHNNITDLTPFRNQTGELELGMTSLYAGLAGQGADGSADVLVQRYTNTAEAGFSYYSLGMYAQDEWKVNDKLSVTLALRADRNSNETCGKACISRFTGPFTPAAATVPYNQTIATGLTDGFPSVERVVWEPRMGFAYNPWGGNTVFRGGIGLFSDLYPAQLVEPFASNPPFTTTFNVAVPGANVAYNVGKDLNSVGTASYNALLSGFSSGQTLAQITSSLAALGVPFSVPSLTAAPNNFLNPKYLEWNFEVQHAFTDRTALTLNYVGNHGYDEVVQDPTVNTYCRAAYCPFQGLPTSAPDARFGRIVQYTNAGYSNYNGLSASLTQKMKWGFSGSFNYTWSHSLDTVSNGGLQSYNLASAGSSLITQIVPGNLTALNYASSDYDFRHNVSVNYVWQVPFKSSNALLNGVAGGWSVSGTLFVRSGAPFSAYYGSPQKYLLNGTGNVLLATYTGGGEASCNNPDPATGTQKCLLASQFTLPTAGASNNFGNLSRNSFRGPKYFNTDMSIVKRFKLTESGMAFSLGANFYNILNHPNFANPSGNLASGTFGQLLSTETPPSSPYGNFQGAAVSGRLIQTVLKFEF
jgi:hypothetical protein